MLAAYEIPRGGGDCNFDLCSSIINYNSSLLKFCHIAETSFVLHAIRVQIFAHNVWSKKKTIKRRKETKKLRDVNDVGLI